MIEINNVVLSIGSKKIRTTPAEVRIGRGDVVLVTGDNGAGKTSLINAVCGQVSVADGEIIVDGEIVSANRRKVNFGSPLRTCERLVKIGVGRNFQEPRLFWDYSVGDHVARIRNGSQAAEYLLEKLEQKYGARSKQFEKRCCRELSYGQQRLLGICLALGMGGKYCLLDEPFAGISKEWAKDIVCSIGMARNGGVGVVVVEHRNKFLSGLKTKEVRVVGGA